MSDVVATARVSECERGHARACISNSNEEQGQGKARSAEALSLFPVIPCHPYTLFHSLPFTPIIVCATDLFTRHD